MYTKSKNAELCLLDSYLSTSFALSFDPKFYFPTHVFWIDFQNIWDDQSFKCTKIKKLYLA